MPGFPHHVTHRGNRKSNVFIDEADRKFYLDNLLDYSEKYKIRIYSYCLMTNHIHLIPVPESRSSLSQCLHDLHGRYADYFNRKYDLVGHVWQERFYACVLDESHLWNAVRYVEQNPVRAKMVENAEDYVWSSARPHCGLVEDPVLDRNFPPAGLIPDWRLWLQPELSVQELEKIRNATSKGIPYSSEGFMKELEMLLGIPILPRKRGRPPKLR